ncbi:copper chaperone PCu(A)C [Pararhizobium haloflavum]|uniref:copper chaperone PCu(A)C n=1 Tax=Pararhizobium haloflavum TaxID=2037914 RepID=UPI000C1A5613|nr:copper chaperone PCu(A)C [Pararhizobium haloflavum]
MHVFSLIRAAVAACAITATSLIVALPANAHDYTVGDIAIGHPWTRATPPSATIGGGYLTLDNGGATTDRLVGGSSPVAERVEIHTMEIDGGVMKMRKLADGVEIPAGETVDLAPGGLHIMLIGLKQPIAEGDMVPVTLEFEQGGSVEVEFAAGPVGAPAPDGGHGMEHDHGEMDGGDAQSDDHSGH